MKKIEWYPLLPANLLQAAYRSVNELAWRQEQALQVIDVLNTNGLEVSCVEPWLATSPGPTPLIFDWHIGYRDRPSKKFPDSAAEFIKQFDRLDPRDSALKKGHTVVFNLSAQLKKSKMSS